MSAATDLSTADVLRAAKQVLIKRGWHQGAWENSRTGCVCAAGAINVATGRDAGLNSKTVAPAAKLATVLSQTSYEDEDELIDLIAKWNDSPMRIQSEVLAAFDRAIALAEAEASR